MLAVKGVKKGKRISRKTSVFVEIAIKNNFLDGLLPSLYHVLGFSAMNRGNLNRMLYTILLKDIIDLSLDFLYRLILFLGLLTLLFVGEHPRSILLFYAASALFMRSYRDKGIMK